MSNFMDGITQTRRNRVNKHVYIIPFTPVPWTAHKGYGRNSFNPKFKEKEATQWYLKTQHNGRPLFNGALRVDLFFEMPCPKIMSKKIRTSIEAGEKVWHIKRPDIDNLRKFTNDCFTWTVWDDDSLIVCGESQKYYAMEPRTVIHIWEI